MELNGFWGFSSPWHSPKPWAPRSLIYMANKCLRAERGTWSRAPSDAVRAPIIWESGLRWMYIGNKLHIYMRFPWVNPKKACMQLVACTLSKLSSRPNTETLHAHPSIGSRQPRSAAVQVVSFRPLFPELRNNSTHDSGACNACMHVRSSPSHVRC